LNGNRWRLRGDHRLRGVGGNETDVTRKQPLLDLVGEVRLPIANPDQRLGQVDRAHSQRPRVPRQLPDRRRAMSLCKVK
jgi:hypothetical protein